MKNIIEVPIEGEYQKIFWDGKDNKGMKVPSGLYLYNVTIQNVKESGGMVFLK